MNGETKQSKAKQREEKIDCRMLVSDAMFFNWTCLTIAGNDRSIDVNRIVERRPTIVVHAPYRSAGETFLSRVSSWITRTSFSSADLRDLLHKWFTSSLRWNIDSRPLSSLRVYLSISLLIVLFSLLIFMLLSYSKSKRRSRSHIVHSSLCTLKNLSLIVLIIGNVFLSIETLSLVRDVQINEVNLKHSLDQLQRHLSPQTLENIRRSILEQFQDVDRQFHQGKSRSSLRCSRLRRRRGRSPIQWVHWWSIDSEVFSWNLILWSSVALRRWQRWTIIWPRSTCISAR